MSSTYTCALFSDLDRTLLPNGRQAESPLARPLLRKLAGHAPLLLAYVSGRHLQLLRAAISDYALPEPSYAVGDVGSSIYQINAGHWLPWQHWQQHIAADWQGAGHEDLRRLFADLDPLTLQEPAKQNTFKLSYYLPLQADARAIIGELQQRLLQAGIRGSVIWSIDEEAQCGLLDVLPASATKLHAIEYLLRHHDIPPRQAVFAGDSGNDLPVIASGRIPSVLVRNSQDEVIAEARRLADDSGTPQNLYIARGDFFGMNGNYAAGVLEGFLHYLPQYRHWLD